MAQKSAPDAADAFAGVIWFGLVVLAVIVLAVSLTFVRRRFTARPQRTEFTFSLAELRRLKEDGALSDEEFEQIKARLLKDV